MAGFIEGRLAELEGRARESVEFSYREARAHLPEDPRARAAALATLMGLDAFDALREGSSVEQLEEERAARRAMVEQVSRESREAGMPLPPGGEEA